MAMPKMSERDFFEVTEFASSKAAVMDDPLISGNSSAGGLAIADSSVIKDFCHASCASAILGLTFGFFGRNQRGDTSSNQFSICHYQEW